MRRFWYRENTNHIATVKVLLPTWLLYLPVPPVSPASYRGLVMDTDYVIFLHALAGAEAGFATLDEYTKHGSTFLAEYDPDALGGSGLIVSTPKPENAMRFPNMQAAVAKYMQVSKVQPLRIDGKPNRPLTMYSAEVLRVDQLHNHATPLPAKHFEGGAE